DSLYDGPNDRLMFGRGRYDVLTPPPVLAAPRSSQKRDRFAPPTHTCRESVETFASTSWPPKGLIAGPPRSCPSSNTAGRWRCMTVTFQNCRVCTDRNWCSCVPVLLPSKLRWYCAPAIAISVWYHDVGFDLK